MVYSVYYTNYYIILHTTSIIYTTLYTLYVYIQILSVCVCVLVTQPYLTLCNLMDSSLPGSSVHGILQVRILERVVMPSSRGSSQLRDQTQVSNPDLPACRQILYHLSHQGRPRILEWVAYPFSREFPRPSN